MAGAREQFDPLGDAYAASKSHAAGRTLQMVVERAATNPGELCCDVGTGTGHLALAMAERVIRVYATDIATGMIRAGRTLAAERGVPNVRWIQGSADHLPLPDAAVDIVVSRTAAHHFPDLPAACREWARICRRGGQCVITDIAGFDDPALREFVHELEVLHDPTHVRAYTGAEWTTALEGAGFHVRRVEGGVVERLTELPSGTVVDEWTARSHTAPDAAAEIRRRLENAPGPVTEALQIRGDGPTLRFNIYKLVVSARRG